MNIAKLNLVVIGIVLFFLLLFFAFIKSETKNKQIDKELWGPWLSLSADQIKEIKVSPVSDKGYITISGDLVIDDIALISQIKDCMNRNIMTEKDKPGYHWFSKRRVCLSAFINGKKYSFMLFFHADFSSIEYQMLGSEGKSQYATVGEGWRSAELYDLINRLIKSNESIRWIEK